MITYPTDLSDTDQQTVQERGEELLGLVRMMSLKSELRLDIVSDAPTWSFNFGSQVVTAPLNDLLHENLDYCRGLALHEAAHATITRIFDMVRLTLIKRTEIHTLFNAIEDCRIETWMGKRNPGCVPWIKLYNDKLFAPMLSGALPKSLSAQYTFAILTRWWFEEDNIELNPQVLHALDQTWPAIERAISAHPPRMTVTSEIIQSAYRRNRTLTIAYMQEDYRNPPDHFECLVRLYQLQMVHIVLNEVLSVYESLFEQDCKTQDKNDVQKELQEMLNQMSGHHLNPRGNQQNGSKRDQGNAQATQAQGQSGAGESSQDAPAQPTPSKDQDPQPMPPNEEASDLPQSNIGSSLHQTMIDALNQTLKVNPEDHYLRTWENLSAEIDLLSDELIQVFHKQSRMKWLSGYATGSRLDIKKAMAFTADPRKYTELWQKKSRPQKIEPSFTLLFDSSGSMDGDRAQGAFEGLVLLTEVCLRLSIPIEIVSFASDHEIEHPWDEEVDEEKRLQLGDLMNRIGGGTNLSGCLREVNNRLKKQPIKNHFIMILSDGEPNDERATHDIIQEIQSQDILCIGLGIGPDTQALSRFLEVGLYEVEPTEIAEQLAQLIRDQLIK